MSLSHRTRNRFDRLLREPLMHFVVVGAALFGLLQAFAPAPVAGTAPNEIVVSEDDLRRLVYAWMAQSGQAPTPEVVRALAEADVREEVLAREAVALGLDRGDPIVRRRLAQKMDFLAADVATLQAPSEIELRGWYAANADRFAAPPRISFHHLYYSANRGAGARDAAAAALAVGATDAADPFMFRDFYVEKTPEQVAREFGAGFAEAVFTLDPGAWAGPVESGYGWHLVRVDARAPGHIPDYDEVAPEARSAWLEEQQRSLRERAFATMLARYEVVIPDLSLDALTPPNLAAASSGTLSQ